MKHKFSSFYQFLNKNFLSLIFILFTFLINITITQKLLAKDSTKTDFPFGYTTFSLGFSQKGQPKYLISQSFLRNKTFDFGIGTFYQKYIYLKDGDQILNQTTNKLIFFEQNPFYIFLKYNHLKFYSQINLGYYSTSNSNPYTILNREGNIQHELYFKSNSITPYIYGSIDLGYQLTDKFSLFANFSSIEIESLYKEINIVSQEVISTQKNITRNFIFTLNLSYRIQFQKNTKKQFDNP